MCTASSHQISFNLTSVLSSATGAKKQCSPHANKYQDTPSAGRKGEHACELRSGPAELVAGRPKVLVSFSRPQIYKESHQFRLMLYLQRYWLCLFHVIGTFSSHPFRFSDTPSKLLQLLSALFSAPA
ncbi:hypothetical protein AMECASPLE_039092 [Ameca splendens]|uniref:Uncharacterized protein n=1 Tax=Ameca splendens TaxID=208324 RepID=A0ABV0YKP5_9TELE